MSVYKDMAVDAGYRGEEADQVADELERQEMAAWEEECRRLREHEERLMDATCQQCGLWRIDGAVTRCLCEED
jgi:hypothetical protein